MTFRELLSELKKFTQDQLDSTLTVEDAWENECFPAVLVFAGEDHDSLENEHPIILIKWE
jgi:hypothetical protein